MKNEQELQKLEDILASKKKELEDLAKKIQNCNDKLERA